MSNQTLYTFVMDWNGGTYVSQFSESDINSAITTWVENVDMNLLGINQEEKTSFIADTNSENPINLDGMTNVWAISPNIKGIMATVNIIKTSS